MRTAKELTPSLTKSEKAHRLQTWVDKVVDLLEDAKPASSGTYKIVLIDDQVGITSTKNRKLALPVLLKCSSEDVNNGLMPNQWTTLRQRLAIHHGLVEPTPKARRLF